MQDIEEHSFTGERALFHGRDLRITHSTFADGESPLKECRDIALHRSVFQWKYPLWCSKNITVTDSALLETARSGIWYSDNISVLNSTIEAPKTFRRAKNITLEHVDMPLASETLWHCDGVSLSHVTARGDYFCMNSQNIRASDLRLSGNYAFDGAKNIEIDNATLLSKDAFWNCENVTVRDSLIVGEYLGWNSKNLTFVDCTIESLQGLCYIENLTLKNCRLINTTLAFEYSTVDADVTTVIDSVMNPSGGSIRARGIRELIMDDAKIDPRNTTIVLTEQAHAA
ncbi:DUF3737 family protein [Streptomyces mirabilis]